VVDRRENDGVVRDVRHRPPCDLRICPKFDVEKYLHQLRQTLPHVPPISGWELKSLHEAQDYEGMVRLVRKTMNVQVKLKVGWVNSGGSESAVAWIRLPHDMPHYGTKEFNEITITMFLRKSLLKEHTADQVSITIAHELAHVVLESTEHPLRGCEKAVELTAMLLGFSRLFETASREVGYLTEEEVKKANELLTPTDLLQKIRALRKGAPSGETGNYEAKSKTPPEGQKRAIYHTAKFIPPKTITKIIHAVPPAEDKRIPRAEYRPDMDALAQAMGGDGGKNPPAKVDRPPGPPPEAPALRAIRQLYERPLFVVALGAAIIMVPYLFLDRYFPSLGVISNAISGNVGGVPYRYFFAAGASVILLGALRLR
jgi:hypothetical protein